MINKSQNVIFIICDDLNNVIEGLGRSPYAPAPNIHRLMERGVSFTNAHNNCPLCLPSRNSMLSGLYPHTTGHYTLWDNWRTQTSIAKTGGENTGFNTVNLLGRSVMLPQHFKANGYNTFGVGKVHHEGKVYSNWWTDYAYGPDYGPFLWDKVREYQQIHPDKMFLYEGEPLKSYIDRYSGLDNFFLNGKEFRHHIEMGFGSFPEIFKDHETEIVTGNHEIFRYVNDDDRDMMPDEKSTEWAIDILNKKHSKPFFLALGLMKPHTPLNVPQRFFDMFPVDQIELPPFLENDCDDCARALVEHRPYGFLTYKMIMKGGKDMWIKWLQSYLACVAFVDEQVGKIIDALDKSLYKDNTIVIFTSDNGYHMGEKEYIFKDTLWEEGGQVPLIISAPKIAKENSICKKPVSLIDLYPTLIDLCKLPQEPNILTHKHPLQGHSLKPYLKNPEDGNWEGPDVALTSVRGDTGIHHSVRSEQFRYTLCQNGEEELYDHYNDPYEWHNKAGFPKYEIIKKDLREKMFSIVK